MANINVLMDGDKSVCCFFRKKKYTLTIIASNGTVSGAGTYNAGTQVNIQATANAGYQFDHWSGDLSGSVNPTNILMNNNKTVTANFIIIPVVKYTLTTSVDPVNSGTITGAGTYDEGTSVTVEATPAEDYEFDHWSNGTEPPQGDIFPQAYATGTGTVGDPWANDCIETAITDCPIGGTVFLKAGYYQLSGDCEITTAINIIGEGMDKTFIITDDAKGIWWSEVDYVTLKGFTVDGAAQTDNVSTNNGIVFATSDYAVLEDIEVKNAGYTGIDPYQCNHSLFKNIYAHNNYRNGVHPGSNTIGRNMYNTYQNIYVWNNGLAGFGDRGCDEGDDVNEECYNVFDNIQAWDNSYIGIYISAQNAGVLSNSFASGNGPEGAGIQLTRVKDFNVHDCYNEGANVGLKIRDSVNVNLTNIISKNNNARGIEEIYGIFAGIQIENSSKIEFVNCQSYDDRTTKTQHYGLDLKGINTEISLLNCQLLPNEVGDIYNPNSAIITVTS